MRLLARSALFPAKAMTMLGLACRWSSFTHVFARANVSCGEEKLGGQRFHFFNKTDASYLLPTFSHTSPILRSNSSQQCK